MASISTLSAEKQREAALREYAANMDRPSAYDGVPRRVPGRRLVTDYGSAMTRWARLRRTKGTVESERPSHSFVVDLLPPAARPTNAVDTIPVQHLHSSLNKVKHPVNVVLWTPDGRRCLTGSMSGEFTLWNGTAFNFELLMQAHDSAVRAATYSHAEDWLLSADNDGVIKYWQPNFNMVKVFQGHDMPIRDLSFSPNDAKFVTACDDASMKIFDFATATESSVISGHSWDVKSVDWHPYKGLVVSGSRDHQVKFWDPRSARCLTTLHGHKNTVNKVLFEPHRGELLATAARDQAARVFDLRMMRDICLLRGHEKDITTLAWHPIHSNLLTTAGADGAVFHYLLDEPNNPPNTTASLPVYDSPDPANAPSQTIYPAHKIQHAHDYAVQSLSWHPLGHILASCANDRVTRFWTRSRPGENGWTNDRYHIGEAAAEAHGTFSKALEKKRLRDEEDGEMEDEADGLVDQTMPSKSVLPGLPGLSLSGDGTSVGGSQHSYTNGHGLPMNGVGGAPPMPMPMPQHIPGFPVPAPPFDLANMDPAKFHQLVAEGKIPVPPPHLLANGPPPMPMPRNIPMMAGPGPGPGMPPMQFGHPPPPMPMNGQGQIPGMMPFYPQPGQQDGMSGMGGMNVDGRRRAPLPSQKESLEEEKRRGNYRIAR